MEDLLGWFLVFIFLISLLGILSYQLMYLTDLEGDYINPYDSAAQINMLVFPEFFTQGTLCILFLITEHWFMFLLSLPYLYFNVRLYTRRQHLVDVTEIYSQLTWEKHLRLYKLCYLIILLVLCYFGLLEEISIDQASVLPTSLLTLKWWQHYEIMMFCEDVELSENGVEEVATVQMAFLGGQLQEHILILYGQGLYAGHLRCSKYMG
ncbi:hypothetical protein CUMW_063590 [Citrus unshiu]|nr:hypothetical protein CUMW_063590 [Citrus unshiu]